MKDAMGPESMPIALDPPPFEVEDVRVFELQGYSYGERATLLPTLNAAFTQCGGWVLDRKSTSPTTMQIQLEVQLRGIMELYSCLMASGVELTRNSHAILTGLCTCRRHQRFAVRLNQVLTLQLELSFLEDVTLHSLLMTGSNLA